MNNQLNTTNIMKRILIALAVLLSVQVADAQTKSPEAAKKAVESAEAASKDAKKAAKVATWTKLASAYMDAYNAPAGNVWLGASKQELQLLMGNDKPISTEEVVLGGDQLVKEVYSNKEFYFSPAGQLVLINVTKPVVENALAGALDAYKKAYEVDVKQSKTKDIVAGLSSIAQKYLDEGMNSYTFGNLEEASALFEKAAEASATAPLSKVDTTALYNAGYTAWAVKNYERAKNFFEKCLDAGYYYEGGEVYAKLGDVYTNLGDAKKGAEILEQGFVKFPQSQSILIGLINYYISSGDNADRLFVLIDEAKKNEPNNASLYYVEGNIYKELKNIDKAIESYYKCAEINPEYEFGFIGAGILYYEQAIELQEKASNELDDNKYNALVVEFEQALKNALEPFEKAYAVSKDNSLKVNIAEYLKNIYYRFSSNGPEYEAGYKKYDEVVKTGQAN
ncbi:MAG: tetratricopeptide repeat protein [Bacteroidales bacterium]|nr:tetratricopeptide repeat protein [Bacteroidales bacterium]